MSLRFLIAILLCVGRATALAAAAPAVFESACSTAKGNGTAVASYRQLLAWTDRYASIIAPEPRTTTSAVDRVNLAFSTSQYYRSRGGDDGKGYAQALYDPQHRVLALCLQADAWTSFSLVANVPPPPFAVVHADLAGAATKRGIHLGSLVAEVEAVYGRSRLVQVQGRAPQLAYLREIPGPAPSGFRFSPEAVEAWFSIVAGRVASISLGTGF